MLQGFTKAKFDSIHTIFLDWPVGVIVGICGGGAKQSVSFYFLFYSNMTYFLSKLHIYTHIYYIYVYDCLYIYICIEPSGCVHH